MNYSSIIKTRRDFLKQNSTQDHVVKTSNSCVLISAPHGVTQIREGKPKFAEIGSLATAIFLSKECKTNFIAKTQTNNDDANYDLTSPYKESIRNLVNNKNNNLIKDKNIQYVIDFHGLAKHRPMDINLGTDNGKNIENNKKLFYLLVKLLTDNGFNVSIDTPFKGGEKTIAGFSRGLNNNMWSIQIEINCAITNNPKNQQKFLTLLNVLKKWISLID